MKKLYKIVGAGLNAWSVLAPRAASRRAIKLFTSPPRPRLRAKERAFLDTAERQDRTLAAGRIVEYAWGELGNPLILLAYGWGYNAGRWRHFVPELVEAGYRVIAYDPPGHGLAPRGRVNLQSNAEIIRALIGLHGRPEAMIGHSFGGAAGVLALHELSRQWHPRRLVIMSSFSEARSVFRVFREQLGLRPALFWGFIREIEQVTGRHLNDFDLARQTAGLGHIDGLLVHDPKDATTPFRHSERYHAYWPGSALLRAPNTGHHLGSAQITRTILDFAIDGALPAEAALQENPLPAGHDLVRFFAGME